MKSPDLPTVFRCYRPTVSYCCAVNHWLILLFAFLIGCTTPGRESSTGAYHTTPVEPVEAVQMLRLVEGFQAELFASEPYVVDPVEMCFDENGGIYVAEMLDYPFDPKPGEKPRSRIRYLEDTDADGVIDHAIVFADQLLQATSVFPWKGGIFVASAPDILYLKDTDGDHVADLQEVWYTGFDRKVSPEGRITNFRFAYDNWIYAANNGRAGKITSPKFPQKPPIYVRGYDFRFSPATGDFAQAAGPTQFGMSFNAWGDRFVSQNTVHLRHAVVPAQYILRNPYYSPDSVLHYVPGDDSRNSKVFPLTQPQQWRLERTRIRQTRYDDTQPGRVELVGGHFTAATGATIYLGDAWGPEYYGNVFIADANGSLIHREMLVHEGVTYKSQPLPPLSEKTEFLASTDIWFRPVNMTNAPDGNLYVMDFYREYIEEPVSIPESIKKRLQLDFYRGDDRGRIWRIRPESLVEERGLKVELGKATTAELVNFLNHANAWHRRTAQRLLLERQDGVSLDALEKLIFNGTTPETRVHALWALHGNGALEASQVSAALKDKQALVRRQAVRLAEQYPELWEEIASKKNDPDPKVRLQVALSAGVLNQDGRLVAEMAAAGVQDSWFRIALLTSAGRRPGVVLARLLESHGSFFSGNNELDPRLEFLKELVTMIGADPGQDQLVMLLQSLQTSPRLRSAQWQAAALAGLAEGLALHKVRQLEIPGVEPTFMEWMASSDKNLQVAALEASQYFSLPGILSAAQQKAQDPALDLNRRIQAVKTLRGGLYAQAAPAVRTILTTPSAPELQLAAIETLTVFNEPEAADMLLSGWRSYGPRVRERATDVLIRRQGWVDSLLVAVEAGEIATGAIDPVSKIRLAEHPDETIQVRSQKLFGERDANHKEVVEEYSKALEYTGSVKRGTTVFENNCSKCHISQGERARLGPDLSGVNNKTHEELLLHILDPSFEIQPSYTNYIIVDKDGLIYDGLLASESSEAVKLRGEYTDVTIRRDMIQEMRASSVSLMPEGLEQDMNLQEMADVIAYLRAGL